MKITKSLLAGIAFLSLCGGMLTSCGDDDKDTPEDLVTDKIRVKYDVETSSDLRKYCDVKVAYTDAKGQQQVSEITRDDTKIEFDVDRAAAKNTYTVQLVANPKQDFPQYDGNRKYTISWDLEVDIERYNAKGDKIGENEDFNKQSVAVDGVNLLEFLNKLALMDVSTHLTYGGE